MTSVVASITYPLLCFVVFRKLFGRATNEIADRGLEEDTDAARFILKGDRVLVVRTNLAFKEEAVHRSDGDLDTRFGERVEHRFVPVMPRLHRLLIELRGIGIV